MKIRRFSFFLLLGLLLGCGSSQTKITTVREPGSQSRFQLRSIQEKTLANGLRVIYIHEPSLPRISYQLFVRAGSALDPVGKEGLAAMTSALLEQGTVKRTAIQIADDFAQLGSSFNEGAAQDYTMMSTSGLSQFQEELLTLFSDVVLSPVFSSSELKRKKSQILAALVQKQDQPQDYADELLQKEIFAQTPYAHSLFGEISSVRTFSRADLLRHYQRYFRPNNSWLAVSGNFDETLPAKVEKIFGSWKGQEVPERATVKMAQVAERKMKLFSKAGLKQTQIRIGGEGIARNNPDFLKLRIANLVLGGAFASRLNQRIRDDLGLTYSISSQFETHQQLGSFEISTFSRDEKVAEVIRNTFLVVDEFAKKGITETELDAAKALLIGQFPAAIETVDRLAYNLMILRIHGISDSYLTDFFKNVNDTTLSEVNQAIAQNFNPQKLQTVIFADEAKVADQLRGLTSEIGPLSIEKVQPVKTTFSF